MPATQWWAVGATLGEGVGAGVGAAEEGLICFFCSGAAEDEEASPFFFFFFEAFEFAELFTLSTSAIIWRLKLR